MSKELDEMIASALRKQKKESEFHKPRVEEIKLSKAEPDENLSRLRNAFEHYMGKEACVELEPKFSVSGRDGTVEMEADNSRFELDVEDVEDGEFAEKQHKFYATSPDGENRRLLENVIFDEEMKTRILAAIGTYLGKAA